MRKIGLLPVVMLLAIALGGCGPSAEDILGQYQDYATADSIYNKAGVSVSKVELIGNYYIINVFSSHPAINQSEENAGVLANRLCAANAEQIDAEIDYQIASVNSSTTKADGTSTRQFYPAVRIPKDEKANFAIVYFEGIRRDEAPELETQPLFFIVELDKKEPKVLTEKPLLAGDLFDSTIDRSTTR